MAQTQLSNHKSTTGVSQIPNDTSTRNPTSINRGRGKAHKSGQGRSHSTTIGNRSTTLRTTREATPKMIATPTPPSQDNATMAILNSIQRVIEGLVDRMDRQEKMGQYIVVSAQTQAQPQVPLQAYNFGNKNV